MKKLCTVNISLLIIVLIFFKTIPVSAVTTNTLKEGVYRVSDLNFSPNNFYTVQNVSSKSIYIAIYDENQHRIQCIQLEPNSDKYKLTPLKETFKLIIVGDGMVYIS
ncbi:hypothetical protein [Clostridium sp. 'White wine YQ']|uniref:hypothetical protein n=1 Tax=Clostridium sp. 'White wine YQ' TaxID=3027474 RepID=UPI0023665350|nr:hypothetical protein [Clostridium sp. 'White wine YQ']MDD7793722.1 hypothetical protein [Clostridium sp. 'White wine YQ']